MTYPENGHFPTLPILLPTDPSSYLLSDSRSTLLEYSSRFKKSNFKRTLDEKLDALNAEHAVPSVSKKGKLKDRRKAGSKKRDLSGRANGTIDPYYGCYLFDEMTDYAVNFSFPWSEYNLFVLYYH